MQGNQKDLHPVIVISNIRLPAGRLYNGIIERAGLPLHSRTFPYNYGIIEILFW